MMPLNFAAPWRRRAPRFVEAGLALMLCALAAASAGAAPRPAAPLAVVPRPENVADDPADVSEYLASWQARAYQRALANARPMTLNQASYDVRYYSLQLFPNIPTKVLTGVVRMKATVVAGPITSVDLDLDDLNMLCDGATSAGFITTYSQGGGVLTVQLDRAYNTAEDIDVVIHYHGSPSGGAFGAAFGWDLHNGSTLVSTLSEPFDARTWWPCKDDPSDKADSVDVETTMPTGYITASNGVLVTSTDNGTTAFRHWHESHPISTYLVSIASFPYSIVTDWYKPTPTDSMLIRFHLFPEHVGSTSAVHAKVKTMIAAYVPKYGPYPFYDEKYGHAEFLWGGGMEHQTCTSLGSFGEYTVAHELGHQWWGDMVTCHDFHHIWLNEGFATFTEGIWAEYNGGIAGFHSYMAGKTYFGAGTIYVPDVSDPNRVFSTNLSYRKPSWVLLMLRHLMGDTNFFAALQTYRAQHLYGNATTEEFEDACEQVSGLDLQKFFQEWIYGEYYPQYRFRSSYIASPGGGYDVIAQIEQIQSWQIFWMPIDVRVVTGSGTFNFVAQDSTPTQVFEFHVPAVPTSVQLDPDVWVLKSLATVSGVGPIAASGGLELSVPRPNPTRGECAIGFETPREGEVEVSVVDAAGRRVARLQHGMLPGGSHSLSWSGRGDGGRALHPGLYWVKLDFEGERRTQRIALID